MGNQPAYYMDFESLDCAELKNGAQHTNGGKVNTVFIIRILHYMLTDQY